MLSAHADISELNLHTFLIYKFYMYLDFRELGEIRMCMVLTITLLSIKEKNHE